MENAKIQMTDPSVDRHFEDVTEDEPHRLSLIADEVKSLTSTKPDQVLDRIGASNVRLLAIVSTLSFSWAIGAYSIMSSAFTSLDCGNCSDTMKTLVHDFDLVGERKYLVDWSTSWFMVGNMLASLLTHASDRWGRRPIMLLCAISLAASTCVSAVSTSIYMFSICRLVQGCSYTGQNLIAWVAAYEHSPTKLRSYTTLAFGITWVIGYILVAPVALFAPSWRIMLLIGAVPTVMFFLVCFGFVPETLHFLVGKGRADEAVRLLESLSSEVAEKTDISMLIQEKNLDDQDEEEERKSIFVELWNNKKFLFYCLVLLYLWTCDNFIYFGLSLYSTQLAGNIYVNFVLIGLVELPAYIAVPIGLEKLGRKAMVAGTHIIAGICFLIPLFVPNDETISMVCWLTGKFAISCSFMSIFVFSSEIFPTNIRNAAIGSCSMLSRIGGIMAPYIRLLGSISASLPMIVLGAMSLLAGFSTLLLPETRRRPLPTSLKR